MASNLIEEHQPEVKISDKSTDADKTENEVVMNEESSEPAKEANVVEETIKEPVQDETVADTKEESKVEEVEMTDTEQQIQTSDDQVKPKDQSTDVNDITDKTDVAMDQAVSDVKDSLITSKVNEDQAEKTDKSEDQNAVTNSLDQSDETLRLFCDTETPKSNKTNPIEPSTAKKPKVDL